MGCIAIPLKMLNSKNRLWVLLAACREEESRGGILLLIFRSCRAFAVLFSLSDMSVGRSRRGVRRTTPRCERPTDDGQGETRIFNRSVGGRLSGSFSMTMRAKRSVGVENALPSAPDWGPTARDYSAAMDGHSCVESF
jgi:hypothetical protein